MDDHYKITFKKSAMKEIEQLDSTITPKIWEKIKLLSQNPRPKGCRKLRSRKSLWRLKINKYRIIYTINKTNSTVTVLAIKHRKEAY